MSRGQMLKYEMESHLYRLKRELIERTDHGEVKYLADEYLNKVLNKIQEFRY